MVADKTFREDLFYRISEITINIPPLRERGEDVLLLARYFLNTANQQTHRNISGYTDEAIDALIAHHWPGNIRELQNKVKSAVIMADGKLVTADDLALFNLNEEKIALNLRQIREEAERTAVHRALSMSDGNMSNTANLLGITRPTLYSLMDKYTIQK
ncbi:helix-turn-helix domain-containing protein [Photobacterium sanguinicancri]|uniref:helix-turn-helix domain-containing protein n=1 Tax=Photobacterium sanguinicancri TaxID=875932 RepID=UPI000AC00645|nr:helix-turn-helix domain-containing protein [Photobacterium sanguinicancri]